MPNITSTTQPSQHIQKLRKTVGPRRNSRSNSHTNTENTHLEDVPKMSEHQCCGVVEEAAFQVREKRTNRTAPQPWIVRKFMVFITLGIIGYAGYVYIGRFCVSAIKRTAQATTGRPTAIALLVIFCILYLWTIWAFLKVVLTPPGFAKDHVPPSPRPLFSPPDTRHSDFDLENSSSHHTDFEHPNSPDFDPTRTRRHNKPSYSSASSHALTHGKRYTTTDPIAGPSYEDIVLRASTHSRSSYIEQVDQSTNDGGARGVVGMSIDDMDDGGVGQGRLRTPFEPPFSTYLPKDESPTHETAAQDDSRDDPALELGSLDGREARSGEHARTPNLMNSAQQSTPTKQSSARRSWRLLFFPCAVCFRGRDTTRERRPAVPVSVRRRPSMTPVLHPAHRYCSRDEIVRPYRAHHCRNCATCVLKFDHHCPWIGQCVGARNHKFFLNFCQAAAVLALYMLATLIGFNASSWASTSSSSHLDVQIVVISSLAALFALFTTVLTWTHVLMIMKGQTTVESMVIHSMKERESTMLTKEYGFFGFSAKRRARRQFNEEWGDLDTEGNIWWTGSQKQCWVDIMGKDPLGWILPIGRSGSDGLSYPVNPRFDEQGRMRRRAEWPAELR